MDFEMTLNGLKKEKNQINKTDISWFFGISLC
jgi:hypothetical protein